MDERPNRLELIKMLIQDRNHHFSHPSEANSKYGYTVGATITTLFLGLFLKPVELDVAVSGNRYFFLAWGLIILFGNFVIIWALYEHSKLHANQRKRLERAIDYLVKTEPEKYSFEAFWKEFGMENLGYGEKKTFLLAAEPDTREWLRYHDRKFDLGSLMILIGFVGILFTLFWKH